MKNHTHPIQVFIFLLLLVFSASCNGQVKTHIPDNHAAVATELPKMTRQQGTYSYITYTGPRTDTSVSISAVIEDTHGNIWAATMGEGVYCYNGKSFTNFTVNDGLITNMVYSMTEDREGNIWFGMVGGAACYNGKTFTPFPFSVIQGNAALSPGTRTTDAQPEVWSMLQDQSGNIWLGTTEGLFCYNGKTFTNISKMGGFNTGNMDIRLVPSMIQDQKGNIWFTSWTAGLCRFDGTSVTSFKTEVSADLDLLEDQNGHIWISRRGNGGVYRYDGKSFQIFFPDTIINAMKEDKSGNIWFCTFPGKNTAGGVIYYNPSSAEIISHLTTSEGMHSNRVSSIAIDRSGKVWLGTYQMTLSQYDGKNFTHFLSE